MKLNRRLVFSKGKNFHLVFVKFDSTVDYEKSIQEVRVMDQWLRTWFHRIDV